MTVKSEPLDDFIGLLEVVASSSRSENFYASNTSQILAKANETRRRNLRLYLGEMGQYNPEVLLVGEAPGYRGCLLTGVPFTSEFLLLEGVNSSQEDMIAPPNKPWTLFGQQHGYQKITPREPSQKEATATMVWNFLRDLPAPPLLWNAYPFHPHRKENFDTNRPPSRDELTHGIKFLAFLIRIFEINKVIAVGNKAHMALRLAGIAGKKVRHPSHGGKAAFEQELAAQLDMAIF